ncbi:hypothetical protein CEXT_533391 [Caerostris extrusa]|uniref:Uncharacterized protein n=1 Tax=Caerostris extrusa TaxID=172846 RepID=A0AAV4RW18_CAEEX|nr:hypothetical protein CEXT_533391 [Caerostris extrusa]
MCNVQKALLPHGAIRLSRKILKDYSVEFAFRTKENLRNSHLTQARYSATTKAIRCEIFCYNQVNHKRDILPQLRQSEKRYSATPRQTKTRYSTTPKQTKARYSTTPKQTKARYSTTPKQTKA